MVTLIAFAFFFFSLVIAYKIIFLFETVKILILSDSMVQWAGLKIYCTKHDKGTSTALAQARVGLSLWAELGL